MALLVKTTVYVDAFNLYYGAVKGTPYRWLNVAEMCRLLLPRHRIDRIKYFTAHVKGWPHDPDQPLRQRIYLRALKTIPNLSIIYGHFLSHEVPMPLAVHRGKKPKLVKVVKTEEKGSDVNLATHLLHDGYRDEYEAAVIVSNDSDLLEPIRIVMVEFGRIVGVLNPHSRPSQVLKRQATFFKPIRKGVLASSQFASVLSDRAGTFHRPPNW